MIVWGENRAVAIQRLRRALHEYQIGGLSTDIDFILQIIESPKFMSGDVTTTYLETFQPKPSKHRAGTGTGPGLGRGVVRPPATWWECRSRDDQPWQSTGR